MNNNTGIVVQNIQKMVPGLCKGSVSANLEAKMATFIIDDSRQVELIIQDKELTFITMVDEGGGPLPQHIISSKEVTGPGEKEAVWITHLKEFTK